MRSGGDLTQTASQKMRNDMANKSTTTLQEVFDMHLHYEIIRLVDTYVLLLKPVYRSGLTSDRAEAVDDGLIVAFCTHARNLLEFFFFHEQGRAIATDYAEPDYVKPKKPDVVGRLYGQLSAQINHLTYNRTDDDSKKIDIPERKELIDIIHKEVTRLAGKLKSGYDKQHLHLDSLDAASAMKIKRRGSGRHLSVLPSSRLRRRSRTRLARSPSASSLSH
jgi:hypothetical protein